MMDIVIGHGFIYCYTIKFLIMKTDQFKQEGPTCHQKMWRVKHFAL